MARKRKPKTKAAATATSQATTDDMAETTTTTTTTTKPSSKPVEPAVSDPIITMIDELLPPEPGMENLSTARVLLVGAALLTVGTLGFYYIPGLIQKDMDSPGNHLINAFYCASITLTT